MKTKKKELDDDFIGGLGPLTKEEEKSLSDFFKQRKLATKRPSFDKMRRALKHTKTTA
jgi:hypothetical protein